MSKIPKPSITALTLLAIAALLCALQFYVARHGFSDPDVYYHLRMASLLRSGHLTASFPWLPFTTLAHHFVDLHLIFHALLIPFTNLKAAPWANAAFSFAMFLGLATVFKTLKVRAAAFWLIVLAIGSADFIYRISIIKANTLSLLILFLAIIAIHRRRFIWLFLLSAIYVFSYGGFFILPGIAGLYFLSQLATARRLDWKPLAAVVLGTALAILAYHPADLLYHLYNQTGGVATALQSSIPLGLEWRPYDSWTQIFTLDGLILAVFLGALFQAVRTFRSADPEQKTNALWFSSIAIITFVAMILSRRFVEYWAPFSILFAATSFSHNIKDEAAANLKQAWKQHWQFQAGAIILAAIITAAGAYNVNTAYSYLKGYTYPNAFAGASLWLLANAQPGQIVFNSKWDEFPQLFYWNDKNYYITGLDPSFLYNQNPGLYAKWIKISDEDLADQTADTLHATIKNDFHSSYLFLEDNRDVNLKKLLDAADPALFSRVYGQDGTSLYRVE